MQNGRKGIGMHKRGVSGVNGRHKRAKLEMAREHNRQQEQKVLSSKNRRNPMFGSVSDLMSSMRKK